MNLTTLILNFRFCLNDLKVTTTVSEILMHRVAINYMYMAFKKIFRIVVWLVYHIDTPCIHVYAYFNYIFDVMILCICASQLKELYIYLNKTLCWLNFTHLHCLNITGMAWSHNYYRVICTN